MTRGRLLSKALNMNNKIRVQVKGESRNTARDTVRVKVSVASTNVRPVSSRGTWAALGLPR